jgi:hypothetical protein
MNLQFDINVLLIVPILALAFSAYELGALITKKYHTISYYAQHNKWLKYLIYGLFVAAGVCGVLWWHYHMGQWIPQ